MKTVLILVANLLLLNTLLFAQKIKISEKNENLGGGKHNALLVPIYEADEKTVEKEWKNLLKKYNAKMATIGDEQFGDNAVIKDISNNTIDIYWKLEKAAENSTKLIAAYDLGGAFLSADTHKKEYKIIETIMYDFALGLTKKTVANQLKDAQREGEKRDKKLKNLVEKNEDLHKDIEGYRAKIKVAEDNIVLNLANQKDAKALVDAQNKILDDINIKAKKYE
jgi:hypothetical protein